MRIKISVATSVFETDLRKSIERAMQLGVHGVQFDMRSEVTAAVMGDSARRQVLHYLKERDLELASGYFPLRAPLADPAYLDQKLAALNAAIALSSALKIRTLIIRPGSIPPVENPERATMVQILSDLASQGNHQGVTLCLLPSGDSSADLKHLVSEVKTGMVTVDADLAEWVLSGQSWQQELRSLFGHIGHFEGRDAARGLGTSGREVPIGRGEIDWDEVAALLTEMDYTGWVNVQRTGGTQRVLDIANGVKYIGNLFSAGMMFDQ